MMRKELNNLGEIVSYEGATQFVEDLDGKIIELFSQGIYTCEITNKNGSIYTILLGNGINEEKKIYDVYYGNIRNESRSDIEKKIQLNSKDPTLSENEVIILGFYCYDSKDQLSDLICCAWNVDHTVNYQGNPSIRGINIELFQKAKLFGFVKKAYHNNVVCCFQPEFVHFYLKHKNEIDKDLSINNAIPTIKKDPENAITKIYFGAPGTGKSYTVNKLLKGKEVTTEKITFHPEFDYASFVGGYKPITEKDESSGKDEIKYKFVPQVFTNMYVEAWNNRNNDYYLVIEEINRGNCAEIFGDIFQLLDRDPDYDITPSNELKKHLEEKLTSEDGVKGIENGKMKLPSNLNIIATMNTSDQSLFPMDSAFKRRWDWEYIPINYEINDDNLSSKFEVEIPDVGTFSWLEFIKKVNSIIKDNQNLGMDKCIGNYFLKGKDNVISLESFINKAIFYLWNDVFKDEDDHIFGENTCYEDFFPIETKGKENVIKIFDRLEISKLIKED